MLYCCNKLFKSPREKKGDVTVIFSLTGAVLLSHCTQSDSESRGYVNSLRAERRAAGQIIPTRLR